MSPKAFWTDIAKGILCGAGVVLGLGAFTLAIVPAVPRDNSDGINQRSGLSVRTDCLTGLQYLASGGGLTPRLGLDGKQIMGACK